MSWPGAGAGTRSSRGSKSRRSTRPGRRAAGVFPKNATLFDARSSGPSSASAPQFRACGRPALKPIGPIVGRQEPRRGREQRQRQARGAGRNARPAAAVGAPVALDCRAALAPPARNSPRTRTPPRAHKGLTAGAWRSPPISLALGRPINFAPRRRRRRRPTLHFRRRCLLRSSVSTKNSLVQGSRSWLGGSARRNDYPP